MNFAKIPLTFIFLLLAITVRGDFEDNFKECRPKKPGFDICMRDALNAIRPYFKTGLKKYNIKPFDPFFAKEISIRRGLPYAGFELILKNVIESGWSVSKVTKFVSDLTNYKVVYTQSFPEKSLYGDYEFNGSFVGRRVNNTGKFNLTLYDLIQTTTVTKAPGSSMKVDINVQSINNLRLHISNLLQGREFLEGILDRIINGAWQPGFVVTRPMINELVSKAFTDIFGRAFQNFPFEDIIKSEPDSNVKNS